MHACMLMLLCADHEIGSGADLYLYDAEDEHDLEHEVEMIQQRV